MSKNKSRICPENVIFIVNIIDQKYNTIFTKNKNIFYF